MEGWHLHWLEASGSLHETRVDIAGNLEAAYRTVSQLIATPRLDILVQRLEGQTITEMGIVGRAYRNTLFAMTVDPTNPHRQRRPCRSVCPHAAGLQTRAMGRCDIV